MQVIVLFPHSIYPPLSGQIIGTKFIVCSFHQKLKMVHITLLGDALTCFGLLKQLVPLVQPLIQFLRLSRCRPRLHRRPPWARWRTEWSTWWPRPCPRPRPGRRTSPRRATHPRWWRRCRKGIRRIGEELLQIDWRSLSIFAQSNVIYAVDISYMNFICKSKSKVGLGSPSLI